jgi:hypothetical protein
MVEVEIKVILPILVSDWVIWVKSTMLRNARFLFKGIIARDPKYFPILAATLTSDKVKSYMGHLILGDVTRFILPGSYSLNFVCNRALGGGGLQSLRIDRQGKTYGQMLLTLEIDVPGTWTSSKHAKL